MFRESNNSGADRDRLQETKRYFIVLDRNNSLVFCNEDLNASYSKSLNRYELPSGSFWLQKEQRTFELSEFNLFVGQQIELMYHDKLKGFTSITLIVEVLETFSQTLIAVRPLHAPTLTKSSLPDTPEHLIAQLVSDISAGKICVHYQPQINTQTNELHGIEALCRWDRGQDTPIGPDVFVALAEDFNFIAELDIWVLDHVCQQLSHWLEKGIDIPLTSVNFSPMSLNNLDTHQRILETFTKHNVSAERVIIEITEGQKIHYDGQVIASMKKLHALGVCFSLDDFGIGYSNYKRLTSIPVSQIKLDRSFVLNLPESIYQEICLSTFSIGEKLGLTVIAEGIENTDQLSILETIGCQVFQGYFFSKPLPASEFERWFHYHYQA